MFSVLFHDSLGVALAGLLVTSSLSVSTNFGGLVRQVADMEVGTWTKSAAKSHGCRPCCTRSSAWWKSPACRPRVRGHVSPGSNVLTWPALVTLDPLPAVPQDWPTTGVVEFRHVSWPSLYDNADGAKATVSYAPSEPPALRGIHLSIPARQKVTPLVVLKIFPLLLTGSAQVGVVGRTGAGKSTLALALFRLLETSDGVFY